jgi:ribonuclease HI
LDFSVHLAPSSISDEEAPGLPIRRDVLEKPTGDFVKINFDAAFVESSGDGAWGFIVRSNTGEFIAAGAGKLRHLRSALQAETEACVAAIEGAELLGINRVEFESDCQVLVSALKAKSRELSEVGVLMREVRSKCIQEFDL